MLKCCPTLFATLLLLLGGGGEIATAGPEETLPIPEIERNALVAVYESTGGENWFSNKNWLGPPGSEASWRGVTVENGHVTKLDLSSNYLEGTLPAEIGDLAELRELNLFGGDRLPTWPPFLSNHLVGQVPAQIGQLSRLEFLDLSVNDFQDPLPREIGNLEALRVLLLGRNQLTGLPVEIENLIHLEILSLTGNDLAELPAAVGNLINLRVLSIGSNRLTGLPADLANLTALEELDASRNALVELPDSIGNLKTLQQLNLRNNHLAGLPESIGDLTNLRELDLRGNGLQSLPETIGGLTALQVLSIQYNLLEFLPDGFGGLESLPGIDVSWNPLRELPSTLGNLTHATYLDISGTALAAVPSALAQLPALVTLKMVEGDYDSLPAGIGQITQLKSLLLNDNRLTDLPSELAGLIRLEELDISNNAMQRLPAVVGELTSVTDLSFEGNPLTSGPIPEAFFSPDREVLNLSGFGFTGEIPAGITEMTSLKELILVNNQLSGSIPAELALLPSLEVLRLDGNQLSGTIPAELGQAQRLKALSLARNHLSGSIPPELGQAPNLETLQLGFNSLTGTLPPGLAGIADIELDSNQLSGPIPPELGAVSTLSLDSNQLSGPIPPELGAVQRLSLEDNRLTGEIPAALGHVDTLRLSRNLLSGSLPAGLCASGNLGVFQASGNDLEGTLDPLVECVNLERLSLSGNQLRGRIPPAFSGLPLTHLDLASNRLTGPVPPDVFEPLGGWQLGIDLTWNGLYAETEEVQKFLNRFQNSVHDFGFSQTVAPVNLRAELVSDTEVNLFWDPIEFFFKDGAYEVFYATEPGGFTRFLARTESKTKDRIRLSGLETDTPYRFVIRAVTEPHAENDNRVYSEFSLEVQAHTGSSATQVFPLLVSGPELSTGLAFASDAPQGIAIEAQAVEQNGNLGPGIGNPALVDLSPESQLSLLSDDLLGPHPLEGDQGWLRVTADNSRFGGMFQIAGRDQLDGGASVMTTATKLYFSRVYDGSAAFRGVPAVTLISLVNPSSEVVGVRLRHVQALQLAGGTIPPTETEIRRSIRPYGMLLATARQLFERELSDGFLEVRVTRGPGIVGFQLIQLPGPRTLIGLHAQTPSGGGALLSAPQAAWGAPFFSNVKLVNTSETPRTVTLSLVSSPRDRVGEPVPLTLAGREVFSADIVDLFELHGESGDGSIRLRTSGPGVLGDVVIGGSDQPTFATAIPFQASGLISQMFAHVISTPGVFSGLALDNPSAREAEVRVTAFRSDGREAESVDLLLLAWGRHSGLVTQLLPTLGNQVGGYLRIESSQPIFACQLFGDSGLNFLSSAPPVRRVPPILSKE